MSMPDSLQPSLVVLALALALDPLLGELPSAVHPVVWMGRAIAWCERRAPKAGARSQLIAGALIALVIPGVFAGAAACVAGLSRWPAAGLIASVLLLKSTFAARELGRAAHLVRDALAHGRVVDARLALRSLCSRDAAALDRPALVAATVESVAENASDSVVAPLFYYVLFGLPGAVCYRAVNTLDAMIGYRGPYEYLGKASARLDDLLNFVPARLTAALLLVSGFFARKRVAKGWTILVRDGAKTASPNAGRPMAAMAGLLAIQLEKSGHYQLGDADEALGVGKIDEAWRVAALGFVLAAVLALALLGARHA
jgi:adenosylcobinamide-phosphate synthase